ncbi:MAG: four helix bundle protein [Melioribacteraceae bacterium]|jgi:four helix bundle protein|nr:four helix bundle protein [Melioribacteraceae bacterium]
MKNELSDRLLKFAVEIIIYLRTIKNSEESKIIKYQLIKSSTSSGANYEEAQGAPSKTDFSNKVRIALKEMRESNYWLKIIKEAKIDNQPVLENLLIESEELKKILGKIASKTRKSI